MTTLLRTACHDWHASHRGRLVDFAGWEMPVQYSSIVDEHNAVRRAAGLFDVGHMGRLEFKGPDAGTLLGYVTTINATSLAVGQVKYALVTNAAGGILDDVLVYRFDDDYLLVVNASNRLKILSWLEEHRGGFDVQYRDMTFETMMIAVQGPQATAMLKPLAGHDITATPYYHATEGTVLNVPAIVSRTGYTGEDGYEVILPAEHGTRLWETLLERGQPIGALACGLGARDTLRLEAGMPLYGHELNEQTDPFTAGLAFGVQLDDRDFLGKQTIVAAKANANRPKRIGLELASKRIAREGTAVFAGTENVGHVTSGTFSPTLQKSIAMAYVAPSASAVGTSLEVDIRGNREPASVVKLPFYRRR